MKKYFFAIYVGIGWAAGLYHFLVYGQGFIAPVFWMFVVFLVIVPLFVFYEYWGGEGSEKKGDGSRSADDE